MIETLEMRSLFSWWSTPVPVELTESVDSRLAENASIEMFSSGDFANGTGYVRNPNYWAKSLTLAESVWNSYGHQNMSGTLISPQDIIYANHYAYGVGTTVRWVTDDNRIIDRTVTSYVTVPDCDVVVAHLDQPISSNDIPYVQILDSRATLQSMVAQLTVPVVVANQFNQGMVYNLYASYYSTQVDTYKPFSQPENLFTNNLISGDSGDPIMLVYNNHPVMLTHVTFGHTFGNYAGGFDYSVYRDEINAALMTISPYHLTIFNPADFNNDGVVDTLDFNVLAQSFNQTTITQPLLSGKLFSDADGNMDGVVNTLDFNLLASEFGFSS